MPSWQLAELGDYRKKVTSPITASACKWTFLISRSSCENKICVFGGNQRARWTSGGCCFSVRNCVDEAIGLQSLHELSERGLELRRHQAAVPCRIWLRLCLQSLVGHTAPASSPVGHRGAQACWPFSSCSTRGSWDQDVAEPLLTRPSSAWTQAFSELLSEETCHSPRPHPDRSWSSQAY